MIHYPKENKIISVIEYIGETINLCARDILRFTPQLYTYKSNKNGVIIPSANSSGVLIKVFDNHFLITVGHVIENIDPENLGIIVKNTFFILNGIIKYVKPSNDKISDRIDVAVWKLNDDVANDIKLGYSFLPIEKIDYSHQIDSVAKYLIVGFPWKKTKEIRKERKIKPSPLVFLTKESKISFYKRLKFERHSNMILDYRQTKVKNIDTGLVQQNTSPQGISGCGVWYIPKFIPNINRIPEYKLVGQIIEQNEGKTVLITTRIHLITEILRRDFGINLPESNITKLY